MFYTDTDYDGNVLTRHFSYLELKNLYKKYCEYTDDEFVQNMVEILHFSCFVCYLKELKTEQCLSDGGIIHSMVHSLHLGLSDYELKLLRSQFKDLLKLS